MPGGTSSAIPLAPNGGIHKSLGSNSVRIAVAVERLAACCTSSNPGDLSCFYNLCISLARGIDYAVAINEKPDLVSKLPKICAQVCRKRMDSSLQAAIMVLMVAMKHACKANWFSTEETREVLALADEVAGIFNTDEGFSSEVPKIISTASRIMSRYYPQIKLGRLLSYADIKPGFQACALSFHVSKNMRSESSGKIQLLVAMKDNIDTSACTINPQKVNLLLNGKGVPWRMVGFMETGPQLPTDVTHMLRYGTNLLQVIGHFEAHYIVLVAFMSIIPSSFLPVPGDYEQPASGTVLELDAEVIEGSSRISLNCPISFSRISKPAKGKLCKHHQCFDLSNYVEMNSRHPSWKCPFCNQPVCYHDLRIDKKMAKILQEVAKDVANVIFHSDGSWEAISSSAEQKEEQPVKPAECLQGGSDHQLASGLPNETHDVYDLTEGDDEPFIMDVSTPEDTDAISKTNTLSTFTYRNHVGPSLVGDTPLSPVLTDSVSPAVRREQHNFPGTNQQTSRIHSLPQQSQPPQRMGTEHAAHAIQRNVTRVPTSNQAITRPMARPNPVIANCSVANLSGNTSTLSSRVAPFPAVAANPNTLRPMPTSNQAMPRPNPLIVDSSVANNMSGNASALPSPVTANTNTPNRGSVQQPQLTQQTRGTNAPGQVPSIGFRSTPGPLAANQPRATSTPGLVVQTPPHLRARTQAPPGGSTSNLNRTSTPNQLYHPANTASSQSASAAQGALRTRQLNTAPIQIPSARPSPASGPRPGVGTSYVSQGRVPTSAPPRLAQVEPRTQNPSAAQAEQSWQPPPGRMRGSLTGRDYADALSEFMIRPTQQTAETPTPPAAAATPEQRPSQNGG